MLIIKWNVDIYPYGYKNFTREVWGQMSTQELKVLLLTTEIVWKW